MEKRGIESWSPSPVQTVYVGQKLTIRSIVAILEPLDALVIGHRLTDRTGHIIWGTNTWHTGQVLNDLSPGNVIDVMLDFDCDPEVARRFLE